MAKRFSSTEIWDEDWFLDMPDNYKLFWFYMLAKCDHAGIFRVNLTKFNRTLIDKKKVLPLTAIHHFNNGKERLRILAENKWLVEDFFVFQYGETFNPNSKVHDSIQNLYNQSNIKMTSIRGLRNLKERVKDKDKDIKKEGAGENKNVKITGTEFLENFEKVRLSDGSIQKLGKHQHVRAINDDIKPEEILKSEIY